MNTAAPNALQRGQQAETLACRYLERQGLQLLERNYHCPCGELDLIMKHHDSVVFVEVRYRRYQGFGGGAESVNYHKRAKLIASASHYLQQHSRLAKHPSRFDVVAVSPDGMRDKIDWIADAFQA